MHFVTVHNVNNKEIEVNADRICYYEKSYPNGPYDDSKTTVYFNDRMQLSIMETPQELKEILTPEIYSKTEKQPYWEHKF